jgi:hypothetical protein
MKREFALDWGRAKLLKFTYAWNLANANFYLEGQKVGSFATKADFKRGANFTLPNGSTLSVHLGRSRVRLS